MKTRQSKKIFKRALAFMTKQQMPPYQRKSISKALKTMKRMKSNKDFFSQSAILAVEATSWAQYKKNWPAI